MFLTVKGGLGANLIDSAQALVAQYGPAVKAAVAAYKGQPLADQNSNVVTVPPSALVPPPVQPAAPSFLSTLPSWAPWAAAGVAAFLILPKLRG